MNLKESIYPIILCGGSGSRLWPLSRKAMAKQFTKLLDDITPFQKTAKRFHSVGFYDPIIVSGNVSRFHVQNQLQEISQKASKIIIEPHPCDTAPAILSGIIHAESLMQNPTILIVPSDHWLEDELKFRNLLLETVNNLDKEKIYTFGINPSYAHTGYGWIKAGKPSPREESFAYKVEKFVEKPELEKAQKLLSNNSYFWNSGIFLGKASAFIKEYKMHAPDILNLVSISYEKSKMDLEFLRLEENSWSKINKISVDYAIMEKSSNLYMIPYKGLWSDIGTWKTLMDQIPKDKNQNLILGTGTQIDCMDTFLHSMNKDIHLVGIGLEKTIAVATKDAVLVVNKERTEDVRQAVETLAKNKVQQAEQSTNDHRPWGNFEILSSGKNFQVKKIDVNPNCRLSLQSHKHRSEHWVVVQGTAKVTLNEKVLTLLENQSVYIESGTIHRLENNTPNILTIIEIQTGSYLGEDDILRFEDDYKRKNENN